MENFTNLGKRFEQSEEKFLSEISRQMMNSSDDKLICMICGFASHASLTSHISRKHSDIGTKEYRIRFPNSVIQKDKRTAEARKVLGEKHSEWFKDVENKKKFDDARSFPSEVKYWIRKGHTPEEAQEIISGRQRKTALLQNNEKTKRLMTEKRSGDKNSMSLSSISKRHGVSREEARKLTNAFGRSGELHPMFGKHHTNESKSKIVANMKHTFSHTSKGEKLLQKQLMELFPDAICNAPISTFNVDVFVPTKNMIIEYFGDFWHCNPEKWNADDYNKRLHLTASEKWDYDERRLKILRSMGYNVFVIWESAFKKSTSLPKEIIDA